MSFHILNHSCHTNRAGSDGSMPASRSACPELDIRRGRKYYHEQFLTQVYEGVEMYKF